MDLRPPPSTTDSPWTSPGTEVAAPRARALPTTFAAAAPAATALAGSPVSRLQPRTLGELLDGGFEVLRFRFRTIVIVAATIILPLFAVPQALAAWFTPRSLQNVSIFSPSGQFTSQFGDVGLAALAAWAASLGLLLATMLTGVCVAHLVGSWMRGADPTVQDTFRFLRSRLGTAVGAWVLALLLKVVGALLCGLGLVYAIPVLAVLAPVVAVEGTSAGDAISRSHALVRRRFMSVLGVCITWAIASSLVSAAAQGAAGTIGALTTNSIEATTTVVQVVTILGTVVLTVVQAAVTALVYVDLRVRTEGLDLELAAAERFGPRVGAA